MKTPRLITTTGAASSLVLPAAGPERDELLGLVRLGLRFREQHQGGRPGFLRVYLLQLARQVQPPLTFERLLLQLVFEAQRREYLGAAVSPVERVSREDELVTVHHPRRGRIHVPFTTLRNHLTEVKKNLST